LELTRMNIEKKETGNVCEIKISGYLTSINARELEDALRSISGVKKVTLDMADVLYIASGGIRAILTAHKNFTARDVILTLARVPDVVMKVLAMTGLADHLNIERG
jgi:anti-sigma B factor antagonist